MRWAGVRSGIASSRHLRTPTVPKMVDAEPEKTVLVPSGFRLAVNGPADERPTIHTITAPFVLIGSARNCGLRLDQPGVKRRHLLLQTILGRLYGIDLSGPGEDLWQDGPRAAEWLKPEQPIQAGPYEIRLVDAIDAKNEEETLPAGFSPLDRYAGQLGPMPKVKLDFYKGGTHQTSSFVNRLIVLGGSSSACKLRLQDPSVSSIHFSLILAQDGLWAADLAGRNGIAVNDRRSPTKSSTTATSCTSESFYCEPTIPKRARPERTRPERILRLPSISTAEIDLQAVAFAAARAADQARAAAEASLAETKAEVDRQRRQIESLEQELLAGADRLEQARQELAESQREIEASRTAAESEQQAALERQQAELRAERDSLSALRGDLDRENAALGSKAQRLADAQNQLADVARARAALAEESQSVAKERQQLEQKQTQFAADAAKLAAQQAALVAAQSQLAEKEAGLRQREDKHSTKQTEFESRHETSTAELAGLKRQADEALETRVGATRLARDGSSPAGCATKGIGSRPGESRAGTSRTDRAEATRRRGFATDFGGTSESRHRTPDARLAIQRIANRSGAIGATASRA